MIERIALQQTRLHTPGMGLDAKGVALGAKGLVLFPSIEKLVAWLSVYTETHSLEDLVPSLEIALVRSKLGTTEVILTVAAESSDRMDALADAARLALGYSFTGTSRHFVQYRDRAAPFGYDASELLDEDATFVLYHQRFTQTYAHHRTVDLRTLLLQLMLHVDPKAEGDAGPLYLVAEQGLGPAMIHYLVRSQVEGEVTLAEWPPASAFEDEPVRRTIVRVPELPPRMRPLFRTTPGMVAFRPVAPGVAIELGYRHPVTLRACPIFDDQGLVLLRGRGQQPWSIDKVPALAKLDAFTRVELRQPSDVAKATRVLAPDPVRVPLRMVPSLSPWRRVTATWIDAAQLPLLRRLAYGLPQAVIASITVSVTSRGIFLRRVGGIEGVPLGTYFHEVREGLFLPAGWEVVPAVAPEVLYRALHVPGGMVVFVSTRAEAIAFEGSSFVPLETVLLEAHPWEPAVAETLTSSLEAAPIDLQLSSLGAFPLAGTRVDAATDEKR